MRLRMLLCFALLGSSGPVYGQSLGLYSDCEAFGEAVEAVMSLRQSGASVTEILRAVDGLEPTEVWETLALSAFDVPRYSTKEMKRQAAREYRDPMEQSCYAGRRGLLSEGGKAPLVLPAEEAASEPHDEDTAEKLPDGALNEGWFVVVGSAPLDDNGVIASGVRETIFAGVETCAMVPFSDLSSKFTGFRPGYQVFVLGGYDSASKAEHVQQGVRKCIPDAYVKHGTYLGE